MARLEYEGAIYHVTVRGNNRRRLFTDDHDRERFLEYLADCVKEYDVRLYVFCLMTNHVHLVLETPGANLSRFMHRLQTGYTIYFNRRNRETGHLTEGRFRARVVEGDEYLLKLCRYVHLNPVFVAGMEKKPLRERMRYLRGYKWSSLGRYTGRNEWGFVDERPLMAMVPGRGRRQRAAFRRFVESGLARSDDELKEAMQVSRLCIGGDEFRDKVSDLYMSAVSRRRRPEDVSLRRRARYVGVDQVLAVVARQMGVDVRELRTRRRDSWVRAVAAYALTRYGGLTQRETGEVLGVGSGKAVSKQLARLKQSSTDTILSALLRAVDRELGKSAKA